MDIEEIVAENIRTRSRWAQVRHKDLADLIGVTPTAFSARMNGHREWRLSELAKIAERLGCEPQALLWPPADTEAMEREALAQIEEIAERFGLGKPSFVARSGGLEPPTFWFLEIGREWVLAA